MNAKEILEEILKKQEEFWSVKYPKFTLEERKEYWLKGTRHGMHYQGEATGDGYSEFSKAWYEFAKKHEPDFDRIFQYVAANIYQFDWTEYQRRIEH